MIKELILHSAEIFEFVRGFIILNAVLLPLSVLMVLYIGIMGGGGPQKTGFWKSIGISSGFVYGLPFGILVLSLVGGKGLDMIFGINPVSQGLVSWFSLGLTAVLLTVLAEIFVDHSFQFRKGNYGIIIMGFFAILFFLVIVYFSGRIPLPWISGWFR